MCLISFLHIFTKDLQYHNRQLIIIHQVGCACFPLVSIYRQGRSHSSEWANLLQIVQTIGRFLKACSTKQLSPRSLWVTLSSDWRNRIKKQELKWCPPRLLATWLGLLLHTSISEKDLNVVFKLHNARVWCSCVPCSGLGYLKVHSFSNQASLAHTVQLFVSTHQCIPLIPLPLDENQLVAWERSLNFFPVFPAWEEKGEGGKKFSQPGRECLSSLSSFSPFQNALMLHTG